MKSADNYTLGKTTGRKINCGASPERFDNSELNLAVFGGMAEFGKVD